MHSSASVKNQQSVSSPENFLHSQSGFILHPGSSPVTVRPLPVWQQWRQRRQSCHGPAVLCSTSSYIRAGSWVEIRIPMRDAEATFIARVVLVRALPGGGYEVGLQLTDADQGARLRIVEQFCYMQHYCDNNDDPPSSSVDNGREQQARDWVRLNARHFPSL